MLPMVDEFVVALGDNDLDDDSNLVHVKKKIRLITWMENLIGKEICGFRNYILLKK